jgi:hypothetical protein
LEFYLGSYSLCLYVPVCSLLFLPLVSKFQSLYESLWIDSCTVWKTGI